MILLCNKISKFDTEKSTQNITIIVSIAINSVTSYREPL